MEPERRIEKWLRAFAKKRREQAGDPVELRPATRQRLQREIARQSEEKSRGGFFSFFFGLRPKLAFAVCFVALAIGGWILLPELTGPKPTNLSMNKLTRPETLPGAAVPGTAPAPVVSPPPASQDKKVLDEKLKAAPPTPQPTAPIVASASRALTIAPTEPPKERDRAESTIAQKQQTIETTAAAAPASNTTLAFKNETTADSLTPGGALNKDTERALPTVAAPQSTNFIASAKPETPQTKLELQRSSAVPGSTNLELFDLAKATGTITAPSVSQVFNRQQVAARRRAVGVAGTPAPVLVSFRVEQNGNNMKIVDADGSVYTGSVQIAQQEPPPADFTYAAPKNAPSGSSQLTRTTTPAQSYFFRVAGTNRNLKQNIIFSGNFVPFTNSQLTTGTRSFRGPIGGGRAGGGFGGAPGFGGGGGAGGQTPIQSVDAKLSNSQINGTIVIGDQKAIDVIATPAP